MSDDKYTYTLLYDWFGDEMEEKCFIRKDSFWPYGEVKVGQKIRGQFGFMQITKVFDEPTIRYGKFIAKSIAYEEMNKDLKKESVL